MASLNVALPDIARDTHATQTQLLWVIDAYSLAFAALLLPGGALGDRYGRRVALIAGLVIFGAGSAVAMTASSATELIALRAILGLGAALVMPATLSTITGTFPPAERARAVSIWAGVAGGAAVLGLLASGAAARGVLVAVDLRPERRPLGARARRHAAVRARVRRSRRSPARRRRRGHRGGRAGRARVLGDRGSDVRLARGADRGRARDSRRVRDRVRDLGAAAGPPAARPARVPRAHADRGDDVDPDPVLRVLRLHVHHPAVPPARSRGDPAAGRARGAAAGGHDDADLPARAPARRALRLALGVRGRPGPGRRGPGDRRAARCSQQLLAPGRGARRARRRAWAPP